MVITRLQRRSLDAEPKDDKLVSNKMCSCWSGSTLDVEPTENLIVDANKVQKKKRNTIAGFVMRISTHGLAPQVFLLRKKRVRRRRFESQTGRPYGV